MKIRCLKIKNFRCFGDEEKCIPLNDLTTFIGINSCGKSAVLIALTKLFGRSASIRALERSDFHLPIGIRPEDLTGQDLFLEVVLDFPELVSDDQSARNSVPPFFDHMHVEEPGGNPYVRIRMEGKWTPGNTPEGNIEQYYYFIVAPEGSEITDENKKSTTVSELSRIEIIYVPAIRNPSSQLSNASGTILWRILNGINWPDGTNKKIKEISEALDTELGIVGGFNALQGALLSEWKKLHNDVRYTNVRLGFSLDDLNSILNKLDVRFSPTEVPGSYTVDALGEGLRSLFYLSLVSSLLELENQAIQEAHDDQPDQQVSKSFNAKFTPPQLTILAIEEPENHIAPFLVGRVMDILNTMSKRPNAQVLVTSHSPSIVKRVEPESIRYLRICPKRHCTLVASIKLPENKDDKFKFVKEAVTAYPEIYFARLVVLGEGDTEEVVLPKALHLLGQSLDGTAITVAPLGGRFVNHFWKLLQEIDIPYITFLDLDLGRETGGWARIAYVIGQLIKNGADRNTLVSELVKQGVLASEVELEELSKRTGQRDVLCNALAILENYHIYFAEPLDMDFMMLQALTDAYQGTVGDRGGNGPRIPDATANPDEYNQKVDLAVKTTLKSDEADGADFTSAEKHLMIWYKYLFLERGKPGTHLLALSKVSDDDFSQRMPGTVSSMVKAIRDILAKDPYTSISA